MAGIADVDNPRVAATYRHNLARAVERSQPEGVTILIEPINRGDVPGYFLGDLDTGAAIIRDHDTSGLRLQLDLYHCARMGEQVLERLGTLLPLTGHVQIAGVPDRQEPAAPALPLTSIFALLDRAEYRGRVGCEYRPRTTTRAGLDWIDAIGSAGA